MSSFKLSCNLKIIMCFVIFFKELALIKSVLPINQECRFPFRQNKKTCKNIDSSLFICASFVSWACKMQATEKSQVQSVRYSDTHNHRENHTKYL